VLKFLHKFYKKEDTPWVDLIWNTYYETKIPHASKPCGSSWWRELLKLVPIYRGISFTKVGDGKSVLFWKDLWLHDLNIDKYPRAFSYVLNEDILVQEFLSKDRLSQLFNLPLSHEAMNEVRSLQAEVAHVQLIHQ
jgi:hypothetical protein